MLNNPLITESDIYNVKPFDCTISKVILININLGKEKNISVNKLHWLIQSIVCHINMKFILNANYETEIITFGNKYFKPSTKDPLQSLDNGYWFDIVVQNIVFLWMGFSQRNNPYLS